MGQAKVFRNLEQRRHWNNGVGVISPAQRVFRVLLARQWRASATVHQSRFQRSEPPSRQRLGLFSFYLVAIAGRFSSVFLALLLVMLGLV